MATRYDHPNNLVRREEFLLDQSAASATDMAPFRIAQKSVVNAVHIIVKSASSANERFYVVRQGPTALTAATLTPATGGSAGSMPSTLPTRHTITLTTNNTLTSLGDILSVRHDNTAGIYDIVYEYHVLKDATQTGSD